MDDATLARNALGTRLDHARNRFLNRLHARLGGFAKPVTAFLSQPEPKTIGSYAKGRQLMAGNFLFAGFLVEAPGVSIWQVERPDGAFEAQLHGFAWLDDLAAVGDAAARNLARDWLIEWIDLYGRGKGAGWEPELAGRRLIRWINHAVFLLGGMDKPVSDRYFRNVARQARFLAKRWRAAPAGLSRFESLTGLIYAGMALEGSEHLVEPATRHIAEEAALRIDPEGGIPSRNPEELMEVFTLLNWASSALSEEGHMPQRQHLLAIERIAPTLRALRHSDGGLARFHGGGSGAEGRLDQALAASGVRSTAATGLAMGYARLAAGRTSVVMDASAPPKPENSYNAHASTLAFELTSGRRPIIVCCGTGADFGTEWRRAGRATPSHSVLAIDGYSSSRFVTGEGMQELLVDAPSDVRVQQSAGLDGASVLATHNGYSPTHGLLHVRRLDLSLDGRELLGEDTLGALSETDRVTFEALLNRNAMQPVRFDIRFHLHPEVEAEIDLGGTAISLTLKSGEVWIFRHDGSTDVALDASVYLERGRLKPRATKQIVLTGDVLDYSSQISWSLSRAQDGNRHIRDLD
ncbi:MAG: heparinase [Alphaproteobacteria bacterium]|nr:heparinase [Alphaproteobacteria bacterium]